MAERRLAIAFAGNASYGRGGQGEFLRQMAAALGRADGAAIYAREPGPAAGGVPIVRRLRTRSALAALRRVPGLRGRDDWTTLLDDIDFDAGVTRVLSPAAIFDGVMGQCARAAAAARRGGARVVVTSLNTHIDALAAVLDAERARHPGAPRSFVHPAMQRRAQREIALADWIRVPSRRAAASFVDRGADPGRGGGGGGGVGGGERGQLAPGAR
jgi:hypothetical protein